MDSLSINTGADGLFQAISNGDGTGTLVYGGKSYDVNSMLVKGQVFTCEIDPTFFVEPHLELVLNPKDDSGVLTVTGSIVADGSHDFHLSPDDFAQVEAFYKKLPQA